MAMIIGVIADTHGILNPKVSRLLSGVELILHAGDIGDIKVVEGLESIAPVIAVRGNNDRTGPTSGFCEDRIVELEARRIFLTHEVKFPKRKGKCVPDRYLNKSLDVVIFGHSHIAFQEWRHEILFFNPGAAGRRRFRTVPSIGLLNISSHSIEPQIILL